MTATAPAKGESSADASAQAPGVGTFQDPADIELLRAYEPIIRYNHGELFFPSAVEGYLAECDLLMGRTQRDQQVVVPRGELTTEILGNYVADPDKSLYLRLVQKPLNGLELAAWQLRGDRPRFKAAGRLARVGLFGRLLDAGFNASLLLRGVVPGGTAAAAQIKYAAAREKDDRYLYYGRVVRRRGWIALHYLYFYFMNDYRSTFHGVNDHEADWEQVFVYLEDRPDGPRPVWIAAAAHDYIGDQLRRRWDDPTLTLQGNHPVLFAGAGSHASYFEQGEYMTAVPLPALRSLTGLLEAVRDFWVHALRQPDPGNLAAKLEAGLSASFVDYGRGDGVAIGPGQPQSWTPVILSDADPWVDGYRGLFGLDTHDRFGGERSPAGPKYTRSGQQRMTWHDPLGFAGLDKASPPFEWTAELDRLEAALLAEAAEVDAQITQLTDSLPGRALALQGIALDGGMAALYREGADELAQGELELRRLRAHAASLQDELAATRRERARVAAGEMGDPQVHLTHPHRPVPPELMRQGWIVEVWSAISAAVLLLVTGGLVWFRFVPWWGAILIALTGYLVIELAIRRRLTVVSNRLVLMLAGITLVLVAWHWRTEAVIVAIVGLALFLLVDNVREVLGR